MRKLTLTLVGVLCIYASAYAHAKTSQEPGNCFRVHNYDDGTLCFTAPPDSFEPDTSVEVSIDHSTQKVTYTYEALGKVAKHGCVHTKEGPLCFDRPILLFRREVLGGVENIELELPNLDRGQATIGGFAYDVYGDLDRDN